MSVTGSREYGEKGREKTERWPHLLVAQRFESLPKLAELKAAHFRVTFRLRYAKNCHKGDYDPRSHAAQFQIFFNVQNRNQESSGHGDYLYFGIPLYDSRRRTPRTYRNCDRAKKFIYTPDGSAYTEESAHDGAWISIDKDILPLMKEALQCAWEKGSLQGSMDIRDYCISGMNMGWEIPGTFDASMQVKGLSLRLRVDRTGR